MLPRYGPCSPQCFPLIGINSQVCTWQPLIFWGYGRPYRRRPGFTPCQGFDVHAAIQMVPPILCGRWWVFHGNLPLQLTLVHSWTNNSSGLEKELKSEKEQRQALQRELQREKDTSCLLQTELQQVEGLKKVRWPPVGKLCVFSRTRCQGQALQCLCVGAGSGALFPPCAQGIHPKRRWQRRG